MKRSERHHLKQNALAVYTERASAALSAHGREITIAVLAIVVIGLAVAGYFYWRGRTESRASALLAEAMSIMERPVEPQAPAAPGDTPAAPTGFATEQARLEAALPKLQEVYQQYPSTASATTARYHAANALSALDRGGEAETLYQEVTREGGLYGDMARLGLASQLARAGQHDRAIEMYRELASDTGGRVPVDGVLMQLGRVYTQAGRQAEAQQTFSRLVQEFPESLYAAEAKRELEALGTS